MIMPLKGEELVDGRDRGRVYARQSNDRTSRNRISRVSDDGPPRSHLTSSRNLTSMHETGQREVASSEGAGDQPHVSSNLRHAGSIVRVSLESDPATIRQWLELVKRRVLIDAHRNMPTCLYLGEGAVG